MIKYEALVSAVDSKNTDVMRDFCRTVCFQDLVDLMRGFHEDYMNAVGNQRKAEAAFREDCQKKDAGLNRERENLQREKETHEEKLKALSKDLTRALSTGDTGKVPGLKRQIKEETEARDEALATISALADAVPEYDTSLRAKADQLQEPVKEAWEAMRKALSYVNKAGEALGRLFEYGERAWYEIIALGGGR